MTLFKVYGIIITTNYYSGEELRYMKYQICIANSLNVNELKRIASAYVEDCRRLDFNELKTSLFKTEGQYISYDNVAKCLDSLKLHENPTVRIIVPIFLKGCLLDQDDYMSPCKVTEEAILNYEQSVIDESNNFDYKGMSKDFALLKFLLDKAWERGDDISVDEKNLIDEVRKYLFMKSSSSKGVCKAKSKT